MRIYIKSQLIREHVESPNASWQEKHEMDDLYVGIGHQEIDPDDLTSAEELSNIIWIFKDGKIDYRESNDENVLNHVLVWGFDTDKFYKGRYEPNTGRLSLVKPSKHRFREVPNIVMKKLHETFPYITEINVFS